MPTFSVTNHALQFGTNAPTVSIYGTDASGYIVYQMSGTFFQFAANTKYFATEIIFDNQFADTPSVTITPANILTQQVLTAQPSIGFFVDLGSAPAAPDSDVTTRSFKISAISADEALLGPQTLVWFYQVNGPDNSPTRSYDNASELPDPGFDGEVVALKTGNFNLPGATVFIDNIWWVDGTAVAPGPKITSFTPNTGTTGTVVTITGKRFTGATAISVGFVDCPTFTVDSDTQITVTMGPFIVTGKIRITAPIPATNTSATGTSSLPFTVPNTAFGTVADSLGCILRWRLVNNGSGTVGDSSGHENYGLISGGPSSVSGIVAGDSTALDGLESFSNFIASQTSIPTSPAFTLLYFLKPNVTFTTSNDLGNGNFGGTVLVKLNANGSLTFTLNASTDLTTSTGLITVGTRYMIAATYDGSTKKIMVNAVQHATQSYSSLVGWQLDPLSFAFLFEWDGIVQEIMFFPSALTTAQQATILAAA